MAKLVLNGWMWHAKIVVVWKAYKGIHDLSPPAVSNLFTVYEPQRPLRSSGKINLVQPRTKTAFADNNLICRSSKYWQSLPDEVKTKPSLSAFKSALKAGDIFTHN